MYSGRPKIARDGNSIKPHFGFHRYIRTPDAPIWARSDFNVPDFCVGTVRFNGGVNVSGVGKLLLIHRFP